jgi:hypothetical protein
MKLENKSQTTVWISHTPMQPGEQLPFDGAVLDNPVIKALIRVGRITVLKEQKRAESNADQTDTAVLIAKLKNSPEGFVRKQCEKYGVVIPDGIALPDLKKLLIAKLEEAGDPDGEEDSGEVN